jgi:hypothetical protein
MHDRGTDSKAESIFLSLLVTYIATERKKVYPTHAVTPGSTTYFASRGSEFSKVCTA